MTTRRSFFSRLLGTVAAITVVKKEPKWHVIGWPAYLKEIQKRTCESGIWAELPYADMIGLNDTLLTMPARFL